MPQRPHLFDDTVAGNIALGRPGASPADIREAAHLAGADPFISRLEDGYQTPVGERGLRLSSGQRQKIALARAFLRDAPLLLLDEPAAHLDPFSAGRRQRGHRHPERRPHGHPRHPPAPFARLAAACWPSTTAASSPRPPLFPDPRSGHDRRAAPVGRRPGPGRPGRAGRRAGRTASPRGPLLRLLVLAGPQRGRLLAAVLAGAAATGCGVALLAVSGFLLARASQHPNIVAISVAVVAVRGLSVGRSVFRYLERLGTHDVAFRVLAQVRVAIYTRLERLAPAGLAAFRSGDLLARLISTSTPSRTCLSAALRRR